MTIFAFVTGYVCALKPIKLFKDGNHEAALNSVSKSALRRFPRLFLPAAAATVASFSMCQMGLYTIAKAQDSWWVDANSPIRTPQVGQAIARLFYNILTTWTRMENNYDQNQWTLLPLLKGSIWVYTFIVATAYVKPRYRMLASFGLWVYFWCCSDCKSWLSAEFSLVSVVSSPPTYLAAFGMQFFWGTLIADLQNSDTAEALMMSRPHMSAVLSGIYVFVGLTFASFPESNAEWMTWSRLLLNLMRPILPGDADFPRFSSGIGLEFITLGILLSPTLQRLLSSRYLLFLGRMSFAVYLLHGSLIKTTLVWMLYGLHTLPDHEDENGNMVATRLRYPGHMSLIAWQIVWLPMLYGVAYLWMTYVDPWCERATNKLVESIKLKMSDKTPILPVR